MLGERRVRTMGAAFCVLLMFTLSGHLTLGDTLRIGVLESFKPVVQAALDDTNSSYFEMVTLKTAKIDKLYNSVKKSKIDAVVSPYDTALSLVTESLQIPYLSVTPNADMKKQRYSIQVAPDPKLSTKAILETVQAYKWTKVSFFYDNDDGIPVLEQLMTHTDVDVKAWRLPVSVPKRDVNSALIDMRKKMFHTSVVLCNKETTSMLLTEARNLAMLSNSPHEWLFYDAALESSDVLTSYDQLLVNFTIISLVDFNNSTPPASLPRLEFLLTKDALDLLAASISNSNSSSSVAIGTHKKTHTRHQIHKSTIEGETGLLKFDHNGFRDNITFTLTAIAGADRYLRGHWISRPPKFHRNLRLYPEQSHYNTSYPYTLQCRSVRVVMIEGAPFTMLKKDHKLRSGNDRFEGYCVDLLDEVARMLKFDYEIYLVHDGKFGSKLPSGRWNGIIGELLEGNATMSVAPLSVNAMREKAVDFTKPFMTRYLSILMRIPHHEISYFEFLNPFSRLVWIGAMCAFVIVAAVLYVLERISRGDDVPEITVRESLWFIYGSLLHGSTDSLSCTIPGRILTSTWRFFALILTSSYTANLAAFLTVKKFKVPIESVTDLAQQNDIKYGTVKDSAVTHFFECTHIEHFTKMWARMSEIEPDSMVDNLQQGVNRVLQENYALFWETTTNKYMTLTNCDIMEIGPPFDPKGFGIGVPPGAIYREELSLAILQLSDMGRLDDLENRWWYTSHCPDINSSAEETSSLKVVNVAGVFFILVGGCIIAGIVCLIKWLYKPVVEASTSKPRERQEEKMDDGVDASLLSRLKFKLSSLYSSRPCFTKHEE